MQVEYEDPNTIAPPTGINVMPVQGYDNSSEEEEEEEVQQEDGGLGEWFFSARCHISPHRRCPCVPTSSEEIQAGEIVVESNRAASER